MPAQSIYYSPHYDYSTNLNFDNIDDHDISFDKIVELDLKELGAKDTNERGWPYSPSHELLFKNSMRQIEFLSSELVSNQNIFKEIFELPQHDEPILKFRGYIKEKEWNTPSEFREPLQSIDEKITEELDNWEMIAQHEGSRIINQLDVNKYILKRNIIKCIISLLYQQMEKENHYLEEGIFPYDDLRDQFDQADANNAFILFVSNIYLEVGEERKKIFDDEVILLLNKLYESIDEAENDGSVEKYQLITSKDNGFSDKNGGKG